MCRLGIWGHGLVVALSVLGEWLELEGIFQPE